MTLLEHCQEHLLQRTEFDSNEQRGKLGLLVFGCLSTGTLVGHSVRTDASPDHEKVLIVLICDVG